MLRAIEPTSGSVILNIPGKPEMDISKLNKSELRRCRKHMQMIFQDPYASLNPRMTVRDIIAEPLIATGITRRSEVEERVIAAARGCRINIDYLRRYPHAFSGGERQRIGIARSLILNPELIICDEPVSALDVSIQAEVLNLLADIQQELNLTYLFISHDLSVVEHVSDRVAVMYLGQIIELAATEDLFNNPRHPYTEALLSAIPATNPDAVMQPMPLVGEIPSPINPPAGCRFHPRCPYVQDICTQEPPQLLEITPGHQSACHLASSLKLAGVTQHAALPSTS